jgi:hypothetical protein
LRPAGDIIAPFLGGNTSSSFYVLSPRSTLSLMGQITVPDVGQTAKGWYTAGSGGHDPAAHEYEVLGCTPTDHSDIVKIAYDRQISTDAAHGPFYLDALKRVADVREDSMLLQAVRGENAIGHWGRSDIEKAFTEIGIMELDDISAANEDTIVEAFRVRLDEAVDPAKRKAVLDAMQVISTSRNSEYLLAMLKSVEETAANAANAMTVERATKLLEIPDTNVDDDFLASIYISRVKSENYLVCWHVGYRLTRHDPQTSEAPNSKEELTQALKLVADAKDSQKLHRFLNTGKMGRLPSATNILP